MILTAAFILAQKLLFPEWGVVLTLAIDTFVSLVITVAIGAFTAPAPMDALVGFYAKVRPFGFWGPVRREAERRGLVPVHDRMPMIDMLNGGITVVFQICLALTPFYLFLRQWDHMVIALVATLALGVVLYFTWYKNLPSPDEV
jgi:hypothetical protein